MEQPAGFDDGFCHAIDQALSLEANRRPQSLEEWRTIFDQPYSSEDDATRVWQPEQHRDEQPTVKHQSSNADWDDYPDNSPAERADNRQGIRNPVQKKSNAPLIGGVLILAMALAGGGWWMSQQQSSPDGIVVNAALIDSLPRPGSPIDITSPTDEVASEIAGLRDLTLVYQELLDADPDSGQAREGMAYVVKSYRSLAELNIIKSSASLKNKLGDALGKITIDASGEVDTLINKLRSEEHATFSRLEPLLENKPANAIERDQLIYGLASLQPAEMQNAINDSRVIALLRQFKSSIVKEIEAAEFDRAAHMLALALSVSPNDRELALLQNHLTHRS